MVQTQLGQNAVGAPTRLILLGADLREQARTGAESCRKWSVGTMAQVWEPGRVGQRENVLREQARTQGSGSAAACGYRHSRNTGCGGDTCGEDAGVVTSSSRTAAVRGRRGVSRSATGGRRGRSPGADEGDRARPRGGRCGRLWRHVGHRGSRAECWDARKRAGKPAWGESGRCRRGRY